MSKYIIQLCGASDGTVTHECDTGEEVLSFLEAQENHALLAKVFCDGEMVELDTIDKILAAAEKQAMAVTAAETIKALKENVRALKENLVVGATRHIAELSSLEKACSGYKKALKEIRDDRVRLCYIHHGQYVAADSVARLKRIAGRALKGT